MLAGGQHLSEAMQYSIQAALVQLGLLHLLGQQTHILQPPRQITHGGSTTNAEFFTQRRMLLVLLLTAPNAPVSTPAVISYSTQVTAQ
jgi:hypothetical protein